MSEDAKNISSLEKIIVSAIQIPGVKVNRDSFLLEVFKNEPESRRSKILSAGPVQAGISKSKLNQVAANVLNKRVLQSSGASFAAGLPGGLAMAATIPADTLQFFGVALKLAQEISYIYGAEDLWENGTVDSDRVTNQLILYYGAMLGAGGAAATVRVLSSTMAKQALKKLPQQALTKTFYYPIVKSVAKSVGVKMTKGVFAKGVSKAIPLIGGVISGGVTFASMRPMGLRLIETLEVANFSYSEADFRADWASLTQDYDVVDIEFTEATPTPAAKAPAQSSAATTIEKIKEAKSLLDAGVITETEFEKIKADLISKM